MRILYALHQFSANAGTGTEKITSNLAISLQRAGHQTEIIAYGNTPGKFKNKGRLFISRNNYEGIPVTTLRLKEAPWDLNASLESQHDLYQFASQQIRKNHIDIIHITHSQKVAAVAEPLSSFRFLMF